MSDINFPSAQYFRCGSGLFFNPRPGQISLLYRLGIYQGWLPWLFSIGRHIISSSFARLFNYFANERQWKLTFIHSPIYTTYIYRARLRVSLLLLLVRISFPIDELIRKSMIGIRYSSLPLLLLRGKKWIASRGDFGELEREWICRENISRNVLIISVILRPLTRPDKKEIYIPARWISLACYIEAVLFCPGTACDFNFAAAFV